MPKPRPTRVHSGLWALIAVTVVTFALLRVPYLSVPLERDEGEYAYIAQRILEGDVPYRDAFDQKPPGVFLAYAAAFLVFGQSIESIHLLLYLWTAATVLVLFGLVRRLSGDWAAGFASLIFAVASVDPRLAATAANTELFMLLPITASMACLVRGLAEPRARWWFACGALAAAACWIKQVAALNAAFVAVYAGVVLFRRGGARASLRGLLWLALGTAVTSVPVVLWFVLAGAWTSFVDAVFLHNLAYAGNPPMQEGLDTAIYWLGRQVPSQAVFWALAAWVLVVPRSADPRIRRLLGFWALASAAGVAVGFRFRPHYFVQMLPVLAALGGVAAGSVAQWLWARSRRAGAIGTASLAGLLIAPPVVANWETLRAEPDAISRQIYHLNPFPESLEIADYIRRTSEADDTIYVVGSEPQILFYAHRRSATRYIFFYPLTGGYPDSADRQRELIREVRANRPRYVVVANLRTSLMTGPETDTYVFEETLKILRGGYRLEFVVRPHAGDPGFDFLYGSEARRAAAEIEQQARSQPGLVVYRRRK